MPTRWQSIVTFFVLTLLLLALVPILSAVTGATMDFDAAGRQATEKTGIPMTSNVLTVVRLAFAEPALFLLLIGSAVPSLAGVVVTAWSGRAALRVLAMRFMPVGPNTPWGKAVRAYSLVLFTIPVCLIATYGIRSQFPGSNTYAHGPGVIGPGLVAALLTAAFLDQGGVLEEFGWRGYAQPALQTRLSPLAASIVVGIGWGLWHVPRDVVGGVIARLGLAQYLFLYLPNFVLGTVVCSVIAAYFMNRTGGSLLPAIMVHGLVNDAPGLAGFAEINVALTPYHQFTKLLPLLVLATALVAISGRQLGLAPEPSRGCESANVDR